jgi:hypothetical protein
MSDPPNLHLDSQGDKFSEFTSIKNPVKCQVFCVSRQVNFG